MAVGSFINSMRDVWDQLRDQVYGSGDVVSIASITRWWAAK